MRARPDQNGARFSQGLQAGGDIGSLAYHGHLVAELCADVAGDHQPGVDSDPDSDFDFRDRDLGIQRLHRFDDLQTGLNRTPWVVLVGLWIAEID